jgi:TonB family protein
MTVDRKIYYYFLLGMFIVHASLLVVKFRDQFQNVSIVPEKSIKIKLVQETLKEMASLQKKQIVQSEDSASEEKQVNEAFLSDKDRKFDRETVAQTIASFQKAAQGNASVTNPQQSKTSKTKKKAIQDLKLADIGMEAGDPLPVERSRAPASEMIKGLENGDLKSQGLSATNDYVEEMALGDFTHLNTVEYKHYGFFHRIRQKLEQFWGKTLQEKANNIFRSGRRLPASDNLITSLQVTLNTRGEIVAVKIIGTSGVRELDDAAIESFNQAGPFPNPPKDLMVNGKATIEWGFVVKS